MNTNPYLSFQGNCKDAFDTYARVLGGQILFSTTWGESPMADQMPEAGRNQIMHATIRIGESLIMGADMPPEHAKPIQGVSMSVNAADAAEADRIFGALSEGGQVTMPLEKTFWAERFGMCTDRFGVPWMVNCEMSAK